MDRVELHFHLLPDVDDGPRDLGVALALAREAVRDGTRPGHLHAARGVRGRRRGPRTGARAPGRPGRRRASTSRSVPAPSSRGTTCPRSAAPSSTRSPRARPAGAGCCSRRRCRARARPRASPTAPAALRERGFGVLIGHPERSPGLVRDPGAVEALLAAGDRLQVNASSLTGYHGAGARAAALELVGQRPRGGHRLRRPPARRSRPAPERRRRGPAPRGHARRGGRGARGRRAAGAARGRVRAAQAPGRLSAQPARRASPRTWRSSQSLRKAPRGSRRCARRAKSGRRS